MRLKATASPLSPQQALALLRQIQQLHVTVDQQPTTRTSQINPEQRGILQQLKRRYPRSTRRCSDNLAISTLFPHCGINNL
jgi:negative regulator of sigma E activity